jgi:hypothetical protein
VLVHESDHRFARRDAAARVGVDDVTTAAAETNVNDDEADIFDDVGTAWVAQRLFLVITFSLCRKGGHVVGTPQLFHDRERAIATAEALSKRRRGVAVFEEENGSASIGEPHLIAHFGSIPQEFFQFALRIPL